MVPDREPDDSEAGAATPARQGDREERLAAALRENLRRRKQQQKSRPAAPGATRGRGGPER